MNNKIIVLDGVDRVGKTTQAQLLLKDLIDNPTYVIHFSGIKGLTSEQSKTYSNKMYTDVFDLIYEANIKNRNLIFDRSWIGEHVYSPIYRNYSGEYVFDIEKKYNSVVSNIYLFMFIDTVDNIIKRDDNKSFSINADKKQLEINLFKEAFEKTNIKYKYLIDINNMLPDDVNQFIKSALQI